MRRIIACIIILGVFCISGVPAFAESSLQESDSEGETEISEESPAENRIVAAAPEEQPSPDREETLSQQEIGRKQTRLILALLLTAIVIAASSVLPIVMVGRAMKVKKKKRLDGTRKKV